VTAAPRLVLVDGTSLIYRAFHALPASLSTVGGLHTNAIYGFATAFRKLFAGRRPEFGAVVFDPPGKTFRAERWPAYKARRPPMPGELREQLPYVDRVVDVHRFPRVRVFGFEADDVIGTLARLGSERGMDVHVISGDKDFAQLVSDRVRMIDPLRDVTYDADLVRKKWGVPPERFVDWLALTGDPVDNIPGVAGIGAKGAAALLDAHGSLDGVLAHVDQLRGRARQSLIDHRDDALLSRELATIDRQVPLEIGLDDLRIEPPDPAEINALFRELEFYSLLSEAEEARVRAEARADADYRAVADPERVAELLAELGDDCAVHPLFDGGTPVRGELAGLAFCGRPEHAVWIPIHGDGGANAAVLDPLRAWFGRPERRIVAHDLKQLWIALQRLDIEFHARGFDLQLASFLIDPTRIIPHRLDQIAREYLHRTLQPARTVRGAGRDELPFTRIPLAELAPFACHLADAIRQLDPIVSARLAQEGQAAQMEAVELPLCRVLGRMEIDGVRVDADDLAALGLELRARLAEFEQRVHELAGHAFNLASPKQLGTVLFEELGLPVLKRVKSGYSTDADVLERLAPRHEIARVLLEHRKLAKLINTYTDVLTRERWPVTGRIHTTFQQTVSATGRLITTEPDLQRTPARTAEGQRIRRAFVPESGWRMMSADWSQIELRLLAHVSGDPRLLEAFREGHDVHLCTAAELFGRPPEQIGAEERGIGKLVNFATIYGQGATALARIVGVSRAEAERWIAGYFEVYRGVRDWCDRTIAEAHANGFVTTLAGRRRRIPELSSRNVLERQAGERIAANTPIQGSAADLCKLAMLRIADAITRRELRARMVLQVHDELVFECPPEEVEVLGALVRDAMEHSYALVVPLVVEIGVGESWADAKSK
jgi:DNA polymerase-1